MTKTSEAKSKISLEHLRLTLTLVRVPEVSFSTGYITPPQSEGAQTSFGTSVVFDKTAWKTIYVFMQASLEPKVENQALPVAFKLNYRIAGIWESNESFEHIDESILTDYMAKRANLELFPLLRDRFHLFLGSMGIKIAETPWSAPNTALVDITFVDHKD